MQFTLNGKKINVIDSWEGLNFAQYLRIIKMGDDMVESLSILTGIDYETLKKSKIKGLEKLLYAARFMNKAPKLQEKPTKIGKYKLPINFDIQFESLAQFEDMRQVMVKLEEGVYAQAESYAKYCAIYCQKLRDGEYDGQKATDMISEIMTLPALEVISAGSFFFVRLQFLLNGIIPNSRSTPRSRRKATGKRSARRSAAMRK